MRIRELESIEKREIFLRYDYDVRMNWYPVRFMKTLRPLLVALPCLLLTACGSPQVWYSPDGAQTARQIRMDLAGCRAYGAANKSGLAGWNPGSMFAAAMISDGASKTAIEQCMIAKGYDRISQKDLPVSKPFVKE
jgi:hypothetical protein